MGLDAHVRCSCIKDGRAKPHPFPDRLLFDETAEPYLRESPSLEDWKVHDRWFADSCEHHGYLISERLGNISMIAHIRESLRELESRPGPRFPILLQEVAYNGIHTGDSIRYENAQGLLKEVEAVLRRADILEADEKEFFCKMKRLCEASIETHNPIVF
jgi:hypothetical protein